MAASRPQRKAQRMPILITNARMVKQGQITEGDLLVRNHRIELVGGDIIAPEAATVIDGQMRGAKLEFEYQR